MKNKYRIGIVANTTWNIFNFRLNIIRRLLDEGMEIVVFSPVDEYIQYIKEYPQVIHVPIKRLDRDGTNPLKDAMLTAELTRKYKLHHPDLIIHYTVKPNIYGAIAAKLNGIPSIAVVTGLGFAFLHEGWIHNITKKLYGVSCSLHKQVVFENIDDRELFIDKGLVDGDKATSIKGCGVNSQHYRPIENGLYPDKTIFTFIGRLLYDKGIKEFVQAAVITKAKNDNTEFWILGEIDHENPASVSEEDLIKWVKDESVIYHGSAHDVRKYIAHSDCIVLPSYREAIARSITEGMAMERPVITTDVAGCREAVEHGKNGYLVPPNDAEALAKAFEDFLKLSYEERHQMGLIGRQKVLNEFDDKIIAEAMLKIIKVQLHSLEEGVAQ